MLISPGTNPLQVHFVTWLNEWVHTCHLTESAGAHCHREYELGGRCMRSNEKEISQRRVSWQIGSRLFRGGGWLDRLVRPFPLWARKLSAYRRKRPLSLLSNQSLLARRAATNGI